MQPSPGPRVSMLHMCVVVSLCNDLADGIPGRGVAAGLYNERDEERKFSFIIPNMHTCMCLTNTHTRTLLSISEKATQ